MRETLIYAHALINAKKVWRHATSVEFLSSKKQRRFYSKQAILKSGGVKRQSRS